MKYLFDAAIVKIDALNQCCGSGSIRISFIWEDTDPHSDPGSKKAREIHIKSAKITRILFLFCLIYMNNKLVNSNNKNHSFDYYIFD